MQMELVRAPGFWNEVQTGGFCTWFSDSINEDCFEVSFGSLKLPSCGPAAESVTLQVNHFTVRQPSALHTSFCISSSLKQSKPPPPPPNTHTRKSIPLSGFSSCHLSQWSLSRNLQFPVEPAVPASAPQPLRTDLLKTTPQTLHERALFTCLFSFTCILRAEIIFTLGIFCSHFNFSFCHSTLHITSSQCMSLTRIKAVREGALPPAQMAINVFLAR